MVVVIIGLLAGLVVPQFIKQEEKATAKAAKAQIELFGTALDTFRLDVGRYPTTQEGLGALTQKPARRPMMTTTTMSSISVNPAEEFRAKKFSVRSLFNLDPRRRPRSL